MFYVSMNKKQYQLRFYNDIINIILFRDICSMNKMENRILLKIRIQKKFEKKRRLDRVNNIGSELLRWKQRISRNSTVRTGVTERKRERE